MPEEISTDDQYLSQNLSQQNVSFWATVLPLCMGHTVVTVYNLKVRCGYILILIKTKLLFFQWAVTYMVTKVQICLDHTCHCVQCTS